VIPLISYSAKRWQGKTLADINELSLSCLIKTRHLHTMLNFKTTIIYFVIMCSTKMVHAFTVSSVVRRYHKYKDVWQPLCSLQLLLSAAQFCLMGYLDPEDPASTSQDWMEVFEDLD